MSQRLRDEFGERTVAPLEGEAESVPVGAGKGSGRVNVAPALSPDGRQLVFLSERDGYSIDVFLADATTGAVTRKLVSTAADPHFDSLQFLESAGAWDATGRRFAFATLQRGHPVLTSSTCGVRRKPRARLRRSRSDFSPSGRRRHSIAFAAMRAAQRLYEFDLERDAMRG